MKNLPLNLISKLEIRKQNCALRYLSKPINGFDFASNDYLGFSQSEIIFKQTHQLLLDKNIKQNGATGSRLISGNHLLYGETEQFLAQFHNIEAALLFNSGYDANVGFFSSVPQKGDLILYDELCHASIRDGIKLSYAQSYKFKHNDNEHLESLLIKYAKNTIYVVTESVFSMDGDIPYLKNLVALTKKHKAYLIVDEAHALGVFGKKGEGLLQSLNLHKFVFARIVTFGKALGCHGAAILGSEDLKTYLINFARSFIYTTGLSPHAVANILTAYQFLNQEPKALKKLTENIIYFNHKKKQLGLNPLFIDSSSAIQSILIPGNEKVKTIANNLQNQGFEVKAILSPTIPKGQERLRFCIHSFNSKVSILNVLELLCNNSKKLNIFCNFV